MPHRSGNTSELAIRTERGVNGRHGARPPGKGAFAFICISALMSALSFAIIVPVLPELVRELGGGDRATAAEWMMALASAWGVAQLVSSPLLGRLADRHGRRPVLLLSSFGLGIDCLFMAFAPSLALLLVARLISGATAASVPTARAYLADIVPEQHRTAAFGKLASTLGVGFIAGPAIGGLLSEYDLRLPFVIAAAICVANCAFGCCVLPESLPESRRGIAAPRAQSAAIPGGFALLRTSALRDLLAIGFLNSLANMIWGSVWVLFCGHRSGWSPAQMGLQMMAAGALGVLVQAWLVGPLVRRFGERTMLRTGLAVSAASMAYAAFAPNGWWFVASMPVAALGLILAPSLSGLLSRAAGDAQQGSVQGAAQSLHGLATIVGPPLYGTLFAWSLHQQTSTDLVGLAVLLSALFLSAGLVLSARRSPPRTDAHGDDEHSADHKPEQRRNDGEPDPAGDCADSGNVAGPPFK